MNQIITTHIHGTVQNFSAGGDNVMQTATLAVSAGDRESLLQALKSAGLQQEDLRQLSEALAADETVSQSIDVPKMGKRVKAWLGSLHLRAAQGLANVSTEVVAGLVTQAILAYFGISS